VEVRRGGGGRRMGKASIWMPQSNRTPFCMAENQVCNKTKKTGDEEEGGDYFEYKEST